MPASTFENYASALVQALVDVGFPPAEARKLEPGGPREQRARDLFAEGLAIEDAVKTELMT